MSITSGFFNSVNGDRTYNADDLTNFFDGVLDDGIFKNYDTSMEVNPGTGMAVTVGGGKALVLGKYIVNTGELTLELEGSGSQPRFDAIVCGVDLEERTGTIYVKTGTPDSTPSYPSMVRTTTKKEICLAFIYIAAGVTTITAADITDTRSDPSVCGYVNLTNVHGNLEVYRNNVEITTPNTSEINVGIPEFDATTDNLDVYLNGALLQETNDYTTTGTGSTAKITLVHAIQETNDNWVTFVVSKISV